MSKITEIDKKSYSIIFTISRIFSATLKFKLHCTCTDNEIIKIQKLNDSNCSNYSSDLNVSNDSNDPNDSNDLNGYNGWNVSNGSSSMDARGLF